MESPFLVQFKKERTEDNISNSIKLKYDSKLDYNTFESNAGSTLLTMTKTQVKTEQPDEFTNELSGEELQQIYLQTKSLTDVKAEKPDEIEELCYLELMATQTFTKVISEKQDEDN